MKKIILSATLAIIASVTFSSVHADPVTGNADSTTYRLSGGIAPSSASGGGGALSDLEGTTAYAYGNLFMAGTGTTYKHLETFAKVINGTPYVRLRWWSSGCSGPGCGVVTDSGYVQSFYQSDANTIVKFNIVNGNPVLTGHILANARGGDARGFVQTQSTTAFTK